MDSISAHCPYCLLVPVVEAVVPSLYDRSVFRGGRYRVTSRGEAMEEEQYWHAVVSLKESQAIAASYFGTVVGVLELCPV